MIISIVFILFDHNSKFNLKLVLILVQKKNRGLNLGFDFDWKLYYLRVTEASLL
mgnify:CR=1